MTTVGPPYIARMLCYLGWPEAWCTAYLRYDLPPNVLESEVGALRTIENKVPPEMCGHNDHVGVGSYAEPIVNSFASERVVGLASSIVKRAYRS